MEVVFDNPYGKDFDWLEGRYTEIAKVAFSYLNIKENYEVDVSLVDDETIHQVNRDYRTSSLLPSTTIRIQTIRSIP